MKNSIIWSWPCFTWQISSYVALLIWVPWWKLVPPFYLAEHPGKNGPSLSDTAWIKQGCRFSVTLPLWEGGLFSFLLNLAWALYSGAEKVVPCQLQTSTSQMSSSFHSYSLESYEFVCKKQATLMERPWAKTVWKASLVAQWWRIHLPMQETQVWFLVGEDPTYFRATKPMGCNYWIHVPQLLRPMSPRACALRGVKSPQWEVCMLQLESSPCLLQLEESPCSSKDPAQPKIKINDFLLNL